MPSKSKNSTPTSYADAGVNIERGNELVARIKDCCKATHRPEVISNIGGFAGLLRLQQTSYAKPVLLAATDGVGTKLKLAHSLNRHDTIGIDLVAMCANDILAQGGEPIAFLDYFACGKLSVDIAEQVVQSIAQGCKLAGCSLIGGETAELPGLLQNNDYDIAGFCIGLGDEDNLCGSHRVQHGDTLIGLASSGIHSNGYSLVRHLIKQHDIQLDANLSEMLLAPTTIYVKALLPLLQNKAIQALAHITGGGIPENLVRVLQAGMVAVIHAECWQRPAVFDWLRHLGSVDEAQMRLVFNDGIGMVAVVRNNKSAETIATLQASGIQSWVIGEIASNKDSSAPPSVEYV
ncbi:MAG: phosphoribosylformylglycinamidine cyclo-ligase [Candidatus Oxydemutatoraceae bacterium WSBS_2016_MAG_OTU14]